MNWFWCSGLVLYTFFIVSCKKFEYDPNQYVTSTSEEGLNGKNLQKILSDQGDSTLTIAVIGDTHTYYEDMAEAVEEINKIPELDFVVHTGDISDHGYVKEFELGVSYLSKLYKPYMVVIGNHDLLANGHYVYLNMFGALNFSFVYQGVKFIFFDSNGREYGFNGQIPDVNWIDQQIRSDASAYKIVLVSHVPFFNEDYDTKVIEPYKNILNTSYDGKTIALSLGGHQHGFYEEVNPELSVPHIGPGSSMSRVFYLVTINKDQTTYEKRYF